MTWSESQPVWKGTVDGEWMVKTRLSFLEPRRDMAERRLLFWRQYRLGRAETGEDEGEKKINTQHYHKQYQNRV